jgi:hypothetical protein
VNRILTSLVTDPAMVLKASGKTPADFISDDGLVDTDSVTDFADGFVQQHPGFRRGLASVSGAAQHRVTVGEVASPRRRPSWSDVLGSAERE